MRACHVFRFGASALMCLLSLAALAEKVTIKQQVLLPDGAPAAGAKVTAFTFSSGWPITVIDRAEATADAEGRFTLQHERTESRMPLGKLNTEFLLIDAPGAALTCYNLRRPASTEPIKLQTGAVITGKIITEDGNPVGGATVTLWTLYSLRIGGIFLDLNVPSEGIITPSMTAVTAADGTFSLRPLALDGLAAQQMALWATATVNGVTLSGEMDTPVPAGVSFATPTRGEPTRGVPARGVSTRETPAVAPPVITLKPSRTIAGTLTDAATSAPVPNAAVRLYASGIFYNVVHPPVTTGTDGRFTFPQVLPGEVYVVTDDPALPRAWAIGKTQTALVARPWVTVTGRVTDLETGRPPATPVDLNFVYEQGIGQEDAFGGRARAVTDADGRFTVKTAVGRNVLDGRGPGYLGRPNYYQELQIKAQGQGEIAYTMQRMPNFLVHFRLPEGASYQDYEVRFRRADGREASNGQPREWWPYPAKAWGETLEIQLINMRTRTEALPWTQLTADTAPENWPREITIP